MLKGKMKNHCTVSRTERSGCFLFAHEYVGHLRWPCHYRLKNEGLLDMAPLETRQTLLISGVNKQLGK